MRTATLWTITIALLLLGGASARAADNTPIELTIDADHPGARIQRDLFGQFAEHLGTGIYGGIWVGRDSPIPNVRGIRSDVVSALRALKVPDVRWPGGCFADEYHWRDGIGPAASRKSTINTNWAERLSRTASALMNSWISSARSAARPTFRSTSDQARCARRPSGSNT